MPSEEYEYYANTPKCIFDFSVLSAMATYSSPHDQLRSIYGLKEKLSYCHYKSQSEYDLVVDYVQKHLLPFLTEWHAKLFETHITNHGECPGIKVDVETREYFKERVGILRVETSRIRKELGDLDERD